MRGEDGDGTGVSTPTLRDAVYASLTAEFATARDGRPMTVPLTPFYDREREVVVVTAAPAFAGKVERAKATPRVSLLLHAGSGVADGTDGAADADGASDARDSAPDRLLLTGRATVRDDDLEANATEVDRLLRAEPPMPKRAAMTAAADFLGTRLGLLLLDWYGLRILIEIRPTALDRYTDADVPATVPAWPAAGIDEREAATYDRAVATVVDDAGYPRSWPLRRLPVRDDGRLRLDPPDGVSPADGQPACVLVHWHDGDLSALEQRMIRGRCRRVGDAVRFDPASSVLLRNRTPLDRLQFVIDGKRRTRAYFTDRGDDYSPLPGLRTLLGW